ncbi:hypothetical protein EDD17DRAFT_1764026 [Pisolithus thermaeus]|nr:hypothetical protein EDD17DRAFT_1764026 [Pisolithus thermaeus]
MSVPWLPHRLYVAGTCSAEVRNRLPPSHRSATKEIILLSPAEATSLAAFEAQQMLPIQTWVRIKKGLYKGDIGFVERSDQTDVTLIVAPHERLYDLPQQSGEKSLFSSELATLASLALEPITSPIGEDVGFRCGGHDFICGLLRLTVPTHSVVSVELPIPDDIAFHMFWRESDTVEICEGELSGSRGKLIDVEWQKRTASVLLLNAEAREGDLDDKDEAIHCCIQELRRVFSTGQTVRIIAGPYRGYVGHIITASGGSVSLQYDGQSPHLEVSELLLETHVPDHVRSLSTKHDAGMHMNLPKPADKVLPGDTAVDLRVEPTANCEIHPTTYCLHIALSHTRRVGPMLATPSNPSISSASPTVVPMKCKHSEDTVEVYPQKKVNLPAALENGPHGHRAVRSKAKRNEGSFSLHPSSKVARSDSLDGGLSSHQVVPLKRKHSKEILETHPPNKVARVVEQGNDLPSSAYPHSNEVSCDNLQGCNSSQQCPMWSLPDELLMLVLAYLPRKSLWTLTQVCRLFREIASPPLFKILHFEPPQAPATLHIEFSMLEALSVWRRTDAFIMPHSAPSSSHCKGVSLLHMCTSNSLLLQGNQPTHLSAFWTVFKHLDARISTAMMSNKPMAYREQALSQVALLMQLRLVAASLKSWN